MQHKQPAEQRLDKDIQLLIALGVPPGHVLEIVESRAARARGMGIWTRVQRWLPNTLMALAAVAVVIMAVTLIRLEVWPMARELWIAWSRPSPTAIPLPSPTTRPPTQPPAATNTPIPGVTQILFEPPSLEVLADGKSHTIKVLVNRANGEPAPDGTEVFLFVQPNTGGDVGPKQTRISGGAVEVTYTAGTVVSDAVFLVATAMGTSQSMRIQLKPTPLPEPEKQTWRVTGYIYRGDTQDGISGVPVRLLGPGAENGWKEQLSSGVSNEQGRFELTYQPVTPLSSPVRLRLAKQNAGVWNYSMKAEPAGMWSKVDDDTLEGAFSSPAEAEGDNIFRVQIRRIFSGMVKGEQYETPYAGVQVQLYRRTQADSAWESIGGAQPTGNNGAFTLEDVSDLKETSYQVQLVSLPSVLKPSARAPELPAGDLWEMSTNPPPGLLASQVVETSRALGPGDGVEFGRLVFFVAGAQTPTFTPTTAKPIPTPTPGLEREVKQLAHLGRDCAGATGANLSAIIIFRLPLGMKVELNPGMGDINALDCVPVKVQVWVREAVLDRSGAQPVLRNFDVGQEQVRLDPDKAPPPAGPDGLLPQSLHPGVKDYGVGDPAGTPQVKNGFVFVEIWGWVPTNALTP